MQRVVIFGNSGSGKSTLAEEYSVKFDLPHLDLDILAWKKENSPTRKPLNESAIEIDGFTLQNENWVIEGVYSDLLCMVLIKATKMIFLNPGVETCINNCRNRPWESHKYESIEKQNQNLNMLLDWVKQYPNRNDESSLASHQKLYNDFGGNKIEYTSNRRKL